MELLSEVAAYNMDYFALLLLRVSGLIFSSPIFGRRNVPNIVKTGLAGSLTILMYYALPQPEIAYAGVVSFVLLCVKELLFGIVLGYVQNLFFTISHTAGQIIDMQMGFGMANVLDVQLGVSVPIMGNFLNYVFLLVFFAMDGHRYLISIMYLAVAKIPVGGVVMSPNIGVVAAELFSKSFLLAVTVALPVMASGLMGEICMGIMMRAVPQVNMFVVGIPVKILIGFVVLLISLPVTVSVISGIFNEMYVGLDNMFALLGAT